MLSTDNTSTSPSAGKLFKSLFYLSTFTRIREKVQVPSISTYDKQIQQCQTMYARLQLDKPHDHVTAPFPLLRGRTMINQTRPLTYSIKKNASARAANRPFSIRSAPAFMWKGEQEDNVQGGEEDKIDDKLSESTDCDFDEHGYGRKRSKMDTAQLSKHLEDRGLGLPSLIQSHYTYRRVAQSVPRKMRSIPLSRNPSNREKIKGRARLDQEMANMKALAFCEQQAPRIFRTASANMKNRDIQLMEEEMRENVHREGLDFDDLATDDDNASIAMMPVKQEELFLRVNTWITEVESACKSYTQTNVKESS